MPHIHRFISPDKMAVYHGPTSHCVCACMHAFVCVVCVHECCVLAMYVMCVCCVLAMYVVCVCVVC